MGRGRHGWVSIDSVEGMSVMFKWLIAQNNEYDRLFGIL